jgi:hybrid cluster-associated redox disulfide protein
MDKRSHSLSPQTSVADLLNYCPQAIPVFLKHEMSCVGCSMAAFETLEDAARIYGVNFHQFMKELVEIVESSSTNSASNLQNHQE